MDLPAARGESCENVDVLASSLADTTVPLVNGESNFRTVTQLVRHVSLTCRRIPHNARKRTASSRLELEEYCWQERAVCLR